MVDRLELKSLDLRGVKLNHTISDRNNTEPVIGINFIDCWLHNASFRQLHFSNVFFKNSNLNGAVFTLSKFLSGSGLLTTTCGFKGCTMADSVIIKTDFVGCMKFEKHLLQECRYDFDRPPLNLPNIVIEAGTKNLMEQHDKLPILPPPFDFDFDHYRPSHQRHFTRKETIRFYNNVENEIEKYRPKSRNGLPIPIVCPDDPNNPILGMTGDDEPTP